MEKKYLSRDKIIGKEVIDSKANIVGNVKDISFDLDSKNLAITVMANDKSEILIEGNNINVVGDVILLNKSMDVLLSPEPEVLDREKTEEKPTPSTTPGLCSLCGYQNDLSAKFCIKCGNKL